MIKSRYQSIEEQAESSSSSSPSTPFESLNEQLDKIGMGKYQWALFALCGCGWIADNMWLQGVATALPSVQREFNIPDAQSGLGTSALMAGMTLGALGWGVLSDWMGRKPAFTITLLISAVFGTASAFAPSFEWYCVFLGCMGFGIGGNLPVDGSLFLEFTPSHNQSLLTLLSVFWPLGQVIASLLAWGLIPPHSCTSYNCASIENRGWRYVLFCMGMITFLMLLGRLCAFQMYESPKFLLSQGRQQEAVDVLNRVASYNGVSLVIDDLGEEVQVKVSTLDRLKSLFSPPLILTTIMVWSIWMLTSIGYTMFHGFLPKFLNSVNLNNSYRDFLIISLCGIPGSIIAMFLVDTFLGRKGTLAVSTLGTALLLYMFTQFTSPNDQLIISSIEAAMSNVMYGVIYSYSPEVFPTCLRGTAVGMASALARITGILAPVLTGLLLSNGPSLPLQVSASLILLAALLVVFLPFETRGRAAM